MNEPGLWDVSVDTTVCLGSGLCVGATAGRFRLAGGHSRFPDASCPPDESVLLAATNCPVEAITVVDRSTGRTLFPVEDLP
jgi:ferredoxin